MSGKDGMTQDQLQELEYLRKKVRQLESEGLKSEKEKFESFAEASPFGMALISDDQAFEYINPKFVEMFGYELSEIPTASHWLETAYPDPDLRKEVSQCWESDLSRMESGESGDRIFTVRRKDGTDTVVHFRSVKLRSGSKLITCEDVTSYASMNEEMQATLSLLVSTLESTADGIVVVGTDRTVKVCNEKFLEIWRINDREILKQGSIGLMEFSRRVVEDPESFIERINYLHERPEEESFETLMLKDGRIIERYSIPQKIGDQIVGRVWSFRDVTEKKSAERAVIRGKEEWELTFDSVQDFMAIFDPDFRVLRMNAAMERVTGIKEEDAVGRFCFDVTKCPEGSIDDCPLYAMLKEHGSALVEHAHDDKNLFLETRMLEIIDSSGTLRGYVHITRDITDRKTLEKELAEAIENLKQTNSETTSMLASAKALLEKTDFTEAALSILESARQLVGSEKGFLSILNEDATKHRVLYLEPGQSVCHLEPPSFMPLLETELLALRERRTVYRNNRPASRNGSAWSRKDNGNPKNLLVSPLIVRNKIIGFLELSDKPEGFTRKDVMIAESLAEFASIGLMNRQTAQELESSEERYRMIFASSPMGIMHYNKEGVIVDCNERFVEILGSSREKLIGMRMFESLDNEKVVDAVRISIKGEKGYYEGDYVSVTGGKNTPVRALFNPVKSENGDFIGAVCILEDVSGFKAAEEALLQAERVKAVADLAGGVAHNFNNLLQIISGSLELASMDIKTGKLDRATRSIDRIRDSTRLGAETVRRLQTFARVRADEKTGEAKVFDVSETIGQAISVTAPLFKPDPPDSTARINVRQQLENAVMIYGRDDEIFEAIVNLLKNGAEACSEGGDIYIKLYSEMDQAVLEISDNGTGIAEEDMKKVFDPFWTTRKTNIGTGLGLAMSHGIVTSHGGSITVTSREGVGTTFVIRLPLSAGIVTEKPVPRQAVMDLPMTVLVVDDMESIVEMLGEVMSELGHNALAATSGEQALDIFRDNRIDIVVCDLVMPRMDGWKVGKAIKSICDERGVPKTPFVLLTGWGGQAMEQEKIIDSGVDCLLEKPVDIRKLMDEMARLIVSTGS